MYVHCCTYRSQYSYEMFKMWVVFYPNILTLPKLYFWIRTWGLDRLTMCKLHSIWNKINVCIKTNDFGLV